MNAPVPMAPHVAANQPPPPTPPRKPISASVSVALAFTIVLAGVFGYHFAPGWNWLAALAMLALFLLILGWGLTGRALGFLINERNLMSLSRFQMTVWTVVIISAYLVIALVRAQSSEVAEPLVITIDWQIWALLGISTTSLIGTPLLNDAKSKKQPGNADKPPEEVLEKAGKPFGENAAEVDRNREGLLYGNSSIADARFTDLFERDELGNSQFIELAQVQMFFFTVIVALVYAVQLFQMISFGDLLAEDIGLPVLPEGLLALMGVSHAGYLGNKAIQRTPSST
jgi:hypothetical protein